MTLDLGRKQTIEELTNGRIRKKSSEELRKALKEQAQRQAAEKMMREKR